MTIILTTHYIEEAEAIADRIGVIAKGEILLVEEKDRLMERMGRKTLRIELATLEPRCPKASRRTVSNFGGKGRDPRLHLRHQRRAHRHHPASERLPPPGCNSPTSDPAISSRKSSSSLVQEDAA